MISSYNVRVLNNPQLVLAGAYKCREAAPLAESNGSNHCRIPTYPHFQIWIDTINTQLPVVLLPN